MRSVSASVYYNTNSKKMCTPYGDKKHISDWLMILSVLNFHNDTDL